MSYGVKFTGVNMMVEWPGRCARCKKEIADWSDAGLLDRRWVHKACYAQARATGDSLPELRSPAERGSHLEMPMLLFLLMFHFGLGGAVAGWILLDQGKSETLAVSLLVLGLVVPLVGLAGVALNIISRRRIELIRQDLDAVGGWRPGR
jgi:hypothetical protein